MKQYRHILEVNLAILMISDEVPEVYFNSDRILHMSKGKIIREYNPKKIKLTGLENAVYE